MHSGQNYPCTADGKTYGLDHLGKDALEASNLAKASAHRERLEAMKKKLNACMPLR